MIVLPELRGYKDIHGKQSLYLRVYHNKKRKYISTKIKVSADNWDLETLLVKPSHPSHKSLNETIKTLIRDAEGDVLNPPLAKVEFVKWINQTIGRWEKEKKPETIRQHWSEVNKIKALQPAYLSDINLHWLNKYKDHLYSIGNCTNTVWKSMKFIKTIVRLAHRERLIDLNPFDQFSFPKYKDPAKVFLTRSQVQSIEDYPGDHIFAATWFVIGCYTGLRYGDMHNFSLSNIREGRLIVYTGKTHEVVSLPLSERLTRLFERVSYKPLHYTNIHYNRLIKSVCAELEINEKVTAHTSRHSFAMFAADAGISIEVTAKLLGHRSIKTTSVYYKISNKRIDSEIEKMG